MARSKNANPKQLGSKEVVKDDNGEIKEVKNPAEHDVGEDKPKSTLEIKTAEKDNKPIMCSIRTNEKLSIRAPITKTSSSTFFFDLTRKKEEERKQTTANNTKTVEATLLAVAQVPDDTLKNNFYNEWKGSMARFGVSKPKIKLNGGERATSMKQSDVYVWEWVRTNLTLHPGSRLSASEVLNAFETDQEDTPNASDLRASCHKIGMLVRRLYPDIQRCKITVNGKRVWVYKNLALRKNLQGKEGYTPPTGHEVPPKQAQLRGGVTIWDGGSGGGCSMPNGPSLVVNKNGIYERMMRNSHAASSSSLASSSPSLSSATAAMVKSSSPQPSPTSTSSADISEWLKENFEYNEGSCVRSMDVLEQYNRVNKTQVRYLSHIGRIIRVVFPLARHIRRSCQGGKREWLYQNIQPCKQLLDSYSPLGKSLLHHQPAAVATASKPTRNDLMLLNIRPISGSKHKEELNGRKEDDTSHARFTFLGKPIVNMKRRYSATNDDVDDDEDDMEDIDDDAAVVASVRKTPPPPTITTLNGSPAKRARSTTVEVICGDKSTTSSPTNHSDLLLDNFESQFSPNTNQYIEEHHNNINNHHHHHLGHHLDVDDDDVEEMEEEIFDHQVSPFTPTLSNKAGNSNHHHHNNHSHQIQDAAVVGGGVYDAEDDDEAGLVSWKHFKNFSAADRFGWARSTANDEGAESGVCEWIRHEKFHVCNGRRVFRELSITSSYAVKVYVLDRSIVTPIGDRLCDYMRTQSGLLQVFKTVSELSLCRGIAAFQFSEIIAHSVVIATTEVWSSRINSQESLRHRSVNCDYLFLDKKNGETCPKCAQLLKFAGLQDTAAVAASSSSSSSSSAVATPKTQQAASASSSPSSSSPSPPLAIQPHPPSTAATTTSTDNRNDATATTTVAISPLPVPTTADASPKSDA